MLGCLLRPGYGNAADLGNPAHWVGLRNAGGAPDWVSCWEARALGRTERVLCPVFKDRSNVGSRLLHAEPLTEQDLPKPWI